MRKRTTGRALAFVALGTFALGGCELIAEFDRSKIDGGGLDSSFPDAPTQDVQQDAPGADTGADAAPDAADAASDAADAAADTGSDAAVDAAGDASDASTADADAGTAVLTIAPTTIDYGNVTSGNSSVDVTFTVTNTGSATSGVPTALISGTDSSQFGLGTNTCTAALAPAATCTVLVHFSPTATGGKTASVGVSATPGGSPSASLAGTGVASTNFSISPTAHAYGDQAINNMSADQTYTVTNNGSGVSGTLSAPVFAGDSTQFMITTDNCVGQTLAASGGTCTVIVHFHPTSTGQKAASMTVSDGTDSATASLGGNGI